MEIASLLFDAAQPDTAPIGASQQGVTADGESSPGGEFRQLVSMLMGSLASESGDTVAAEVRAGQQAQSEQMVESDEPSEGETPAESAEDSPKEDRPLRPEEAVPQMIGTEVAVAPDVEAPVVGNGQQPEVVPIQAQTGSTSRAGLTEPAAIAEPTDKIDQTATAEPVRPKGPAASAQPEPAKVVTKANNDAPQPAGQSIAMPEADVETPALVAPGAVRSNAPAHRPAAQTADVRPGNGIVPPAPQESRVRGPLDWNNVWALADRVVISSDSAPVAAQPVAAGWTIASADPSVGRQAAVLLGSAADMLPQGRSVVVETGKPLPELLSLLTADDGLPVVEKSNGQPASFGSEMQHGQTWMPLSDQQIPGSEAVNAVSRSHAHLPPEPVVSAKMINQIVQAAKVHFFEGGAGMTLRLDPPHLGTVHMSVSADQGVVTASLHTSTEAARQAIQADLESLRQSLSNAGINVDTINVSVGADPDQGWAEQGGLRGGRQNGGGHAGRGFGRGLAGIDTASAGVEAHRPASGRLDYLV